VLGTPPSDHGISLSLLEGCLTLIPITASFAWPRLGWSCFWLLESVFGRLAKQRGMAVAAVGFFALLLRLAILPQCPIPLPVVPDAFSFLLSADTFVHGRLTNPTPAMWTHLETIHVTMQPTYMSMYFPAQGLVMTAGKVLFGNRRVRFLVLCDTVLAAGMSIEIFVLPHYLAPFTATFYGIALQAMRHFRVWSAGVILLAGR